MFFCVKIYLLSNRLYYKRLGFLSRLLDMFNRLLFSCWIPGKVKSGRGLVLGYGGLGIVIHHDCVLGERVHIDQQVTLGGNATEKGVPVIGNDVYIGAGAKILGPVVIGDNCVIAANSVVTKDIPSGSVAAGIPVKVIREGITLKNFLYHMKSEDAEKSE